MAIRMEEMNNEHLLQSQVLDKYCRSTLCTVFRDDFIFIWDMKYSLSCF